MPPDDLALREILYLALAEPIGLLLRSNDPARARAQLYAERKRSGDPDLAGLQIRSSPLEDGELVIVRGEATSSCGL